MLPQSIIEFREKMMEYADSKDVYGVHISRNYSQIDTRTISPSVVNQDGKTFFTSNKWLTT